ncbi:MAG TPA: cytochrome c biogenesis protein CcdA [Tissierellaceae bacterium]|nr:cytochrome c biogenesis protein CcdA [Tissierellaceae bacterium]
MKGEIYLLTENISYTVALAAGFLSFFSPCIIPLIPAYIMYLTGVTMEEDLKDKRLLALSRTLGFIIGFTIIFVIMGTSASFMGKVFIRNKKIFAKISGLLITFFGLNMMGIFNIGFLNRTRQVSTPKKVTNWFSSTLMGMAFAAGWTPCFGPVLASILVYAGGTDTVSKGVILLLIYSIGMAIPFILTALFINIFIDLVNRTEKFLIYLPKIGGLIMVIFGLLVFFDKVINISRWLI